MSERRPDPYVQLADQRGVLKISDLQGEDMSFFATISPPSFQSETGCSAYDTLKRRCTSHRFSPRTGGLEGKRGKQGKRGKRVEVDGIIRLQ